MQYNHKFHFIDLINNKLILFHITNDNIKSFMFDLISFKLIIPYKYLLDYLKISSKEIDVMEIKSFLSSIEDFIILYNIYFNKICLIPKSDVYDKVINKNFRFIDKYLLSEIVTTFNNTRDLLKIDNSKLNQDYFHKLFRDLLFLSNFNLGELLKTYLTVFYFESNAVGKNITTCTRPSFISYNLTTSKPYYSRSELINLGLNMNIINNDDTYYDQTKVALLCNTIKENDINVEVLLNHQQYIEKHNCKYLIIYFTFYGSYFMNKYLRNLEKDIMHKDEHLETLIFKMWKLVYLSPAFDKNYIVYRFISDDSFIKYLKIGELFIDPGFVSTTRNPFYDYKDNNFGFILLKIKLPKNISGVGLCIETYSLFKNEEEIILPPNSMLRLISISDNYRYYHPSYTAKKLIVKMYEFELIGKKNIIMNFNFTPINIKLVDPLLVKLGENDDIYDEMKFFDDNFVNEINHVNIIINNKTYDFICNWYNSSDVYNDFFYIKTKLGYVMYLQDEYGRITISIEINEIMVVNYFQKFSDINGLNPSDIELLNIISNISYMFRINSVIIHPYYNTCKIFKKNNNVEKLMGDTYSILHQAADLITFCSDVYLYLKYDTVRFDKINGIINNFYYFQLDKMKNMKIEEMIKPTDNDDLFNYYDEVYKNTSTFKNTIVSYYLFIVEQYFYKVNIFEQKMHRIFNDPKTNPFINKYYNFEPYTYLYEKGFISEIPTYTSKNYGERTFAINNIYQKIYNNEYREFRFNRKK